MKKAARYISLLLCVLLLSTLVTARAELVTIGITLTGLVPQEDGSFRNTVPEGDFRVYQNGQEIGVITAGGETLAVNNRDRVRIEPLPETFAPEWDLSTAYLAPDVSGSGTVIIPVTIYARDPEPIPAATEAPAAQPGTEIPEETAGEARENPETPAPTEVPAAQTAKNGPIQTPTLPPYTEPAAETTPEPALPGLPEGAGAGTLRVQVFNDKNGNGEQGSLEDGIKGITVYLLNEAEEALTSAVTGADGMAVFTGVPAGKYRTRITLPEEYYFTQYGGENSLIRNAYGLINKGEQTSRVLEIRTGSETEQGVGIRKNACTMSGFCWLEDTVDGLYKKGETKIPGIRIRMEHQLGDLIYETETDAEGNWKIDHLRPGFYTVTVTAPEGLMLTRYTQSRGTRSFLTSDNPKRRVDVEKSGTANIGFNWAAQICGRCYLDANYNGLYDEGELPLKNVKLTAKYSFDGETASTAVSGEDGTYVLDGLRGNSYSIQATLPAGGYTFTRTAPAEALGNLFSARGDQRASTLSNYTILDAEKRQMDIGAILPGSVEGTVYFDDNFSATQDGSEKTVSGFLVNILDAAGNIVASDRSNAWGVYELTGLVPGEYTLEADAVKGYAFTKRGDGNMMLNLNAGAGYSESFRVELGEKRTGMHIGMIRPGTVEGTVFADRNDNGLRDPEENGLAGVTVRLMSEEEGEAFRAEIGEDGKFLFDAVMPGRYYVEYELPENDVFARVKDGGNTVSAEGTVARTESFDFVTGELRKAPLCGALTLGRIEGTAFHDCDGNGLMENEDALAGVTVELIPSRSELEPVTAVTDENGRFALEQLRPDVYELAVTCPEGYVLSRTDSLELPLKAGLKEQAVSLNVRMGDEWTGQFTGAVLPAAITGRLWLDENNNGLFDDGERTPAGYRVTVTDESTGAVFDTPVTDENGVFSAAGMIPGSFSVSLPLDERTLAAKPGDSAFAEENGALVLAGIRLRENEIREGLLLGIVRYTAVSGQAWIDRGDGIESLAGVQITMRNAEDGSVIAETKTESDGSYRMDGLMPCVFRLEVTAPEGCVIIEPDDARLAGGLRSVPSETSNRLGFTEDMALEMDRDIGGMDIGCVLPGRLGDFCWVDLNENGLQDGGEPGVPNVRIELLRDGEYVAETVTNQYGFYRFVDLYPAVYTLKVHVPEEVVPAWRRTDLPMIASVLEASDEDTAYSVPVTVESNRDQFNADLGFVCLEAGVLPEGAGEGETQDWSKKY